MELDAGEKWAAKLVRREFLELPAGGRYFRCSLYAQEVGCAWLGQHDQGPAIQLAFQPTYWGHNIPLLPLLRLLVDHSEKRHNVQVTFSCGRHHDQARPVLQALGFREQTRDRLLMLKNLASAPHTQENF